MSEALTARPPRHLPSRVWMWAVAAAFVIAAAVTILLAIAASDGGGTNDRPAPAVEAPQPGGADFSQDVCQPARIATAC